MPTEFTVNIPVGADYERFAEEACAAVNAITPALVSGAWHSSPMRFVASRALTQAEADAAAAAAAALAVSPQEDT